MNRDTEIQLEDLTAMREASRRERNFSQPVCPRCQSKMIRHRVKSNTLICMRCGHTWPREEN